MSHAHLSGVRRLAMAASVGGLVMALPLGVAGQDLQLQHHGDTPYVTGGVGQEEREAIGDLAQQEGLDLQLVLATPQGSFMADATVRITDADGQVVLEASSDGPWIYTSLPVGEYQVTVDFPAGPQEESLTVEEGAQQVVLTSPDD